MRIFLFIDSWLSYLPLFGLGITVISTAVGVSRWLYLKNKEGHVAENLKPYFSNMDVYTATRFYIPTKYQNISPSTDEGATNKNAAKSKLIPLFLNENFNNTTQSEKYYLILADTGMGKTTFLINLFLQYQSGLIKNFLGSKYEAKLYLFPLGSPDIWKDIKAIKDKKNAILLLDAFDEDIKSVEDHSARMKAIIQLTKDFKQIVITCRTQFFPSDIEIPDDTGFITFGGEQEKCKFQRFYISLFDVPDIKKYLWKRFSIFQKAKRDKALQIVNNNSNIVMRPMLLKYINDLVESKQEFEYGYQVYELLIQKWVERESKKKGISEKYGSEEKYRKVLLNFSQALAVNLYENSEKRGGYFINKNEIIKNPSGIELSDFEEDSLTDIEIRSKSLLTRDAEGKYKFSHKSIFEYFLALKLKKDTDFLSNFNFDGMSAAKNFVYDMWLSEIKRWNGRFNTFKRTIDNKFSSESRYLSSINITNILFINSITLYDLDRVDLRGLFIFSGLKTVNIYNFKKHPLLYKLYEWIRNDRAFEYLCNIFNKLKLPELEKHLILIHKQNKTQSENITKHIQDNQIIKGEFRDQIIEARQRFKAEGIIEIPNWSGMESIIDSKCKYFVTLFLNSSSLTHAETSKFLHDLIEQLCGIESFISSMNDFKRNANMNDFKRNANKFYIYF